MSKLSCLLAAISCRRYTELACRCHDSQLTLLEKLAFRVHHALCMVCRRFLRQLAAIDNAAKELENDDVFDPNIQLSSDAKKRIERVLSSANKDE